MNLRAARTLPMAALAWIALPGFGGTVEGTVVNSVTAQPIRRADIVLRHADFQPARGNALGALETDSEGRFRIANLPAGDYVIQAQRAGFHAKSFRIRVGDQTVPIRIRLSPHSVISGRVVDDEGEPMVDVQVTALTPLTDPSGRQTWRSVGAMTNDRGEYRIWGIAAGRYFVRAQWRQSGRPGRGAARSWLPTYYPNALSTGEAAAVVTAPGVEASGIEIALRRGTLSTISGSVECAGGPPRSPILVTLVPRSEHSSYEQQTQVLSAGQTAFRFDGVRPGSWMLTASTLEGEPILRGSLPLEVSGSDSSDLVVSAVPAAVVRGKVRIEGGHKGNYRQVGLSFDGEEPGQLSMPPARFDDDGAFSGSLAAPARYFLRVTGKPMQDAYVESIRIGSQDVLSKPFDAPAGTVPPITIEFRLDGGRISGVVQETEPDDEYFVVVLAADGAMRKALPVPEVFAKDGSFEFRGLRPGAYFALAIASEERSKLDWPETLAALPQIATRVEIQSGASVPLNLKPVRLP